MIDRLLNLLKRVWRRVRREIRKRRLVFALIFAIVAALGLTTLSVTIYSIGGYYRYDLSRPGYEKERQEIAKTPTDVTLDTASPIDKEAITSLVKTFDQHIKNLDSYNFFGDDSLNDSSLQLTTSN